MRLNVPRFARPAAARLRAVLHGALGGSAVWTSPGLAAAAVAWGALGLYYALLTYEILPTYSLMGDAEKLRHMDAAAWVALPSLALASWGVLMLVRHRRRRGEGA